MSGAYWSHAIDGHLIGEPAGPFIHLRLATAPSAPPRGMVLTARTARELAAALLAAAADKEAALSGRCACGDAIDPEVDECVHCDMRRRVEYRAGLHALN